MLGTYQNAIFAVPENPVMRAVVGAPLLLTAPEKKGVTGFGASAPGCGMGCAGNRTCSKCAQGMGAWDRPFAKFYNNMGMDLTGTIGQRGGMVLDGPMMIKGFGNAGDEGLKLYGDWYGSQQHGGLHLNGDCNGLGSYFPSNAHAYRGFSGLGDVGTFITNLTSGNFGEALTGNDFFSGVPNWIVVPAGLWFLMSIIEDTKRTYRSVKTSSRKRSAKRKRIASAKKTLAEDSLF
jgi:hypothetical protein